MSAKTRQHAEKSREKARLRQIPWHLVSCLLKYLVDRSTYIGYIGCKTVM